MKLSGHLDKKNTRHRVETLLPLVIEASRKKTFIRNGEASMADGYRSAAARERMAFGIPPSESDDVTDATHRDESLSAAESEMSSINASLWREDNDGLSESAESIFRAVEPLPKQVTQRNMTINSISGLPDSVLFLPL
ncbi:hypothetical protein CPB84DRAFT_1202884 [Gymnopilus junonius]|uniref:Uncharacterized protein n=1 Tax=Gymnopilus junonius TaxID=109634 RepID=A0A9P5TM35_GYMJU|nr:hypothetical protein CPB84DRAFT_1202884 [Gymnopilus junonius]